MLSWIVGFDVPKKSCIRLGPNPDGKGQYRGKWAPIGKYKDCLPWAVQKRLKRPRCRLWCWVGWDQRNHVLDGARFPMGRGNFEGKGTPRRYPDVSCAETGEPIIYTVCQKMFHLWLAITLTHANGFWYFLAGMLPIKQAIKRHFTMPHQLTCASALPLKTGKRENCIFPQMLC